MKRLALFAIGICVTGGTARANSFVKSIDLGTHTRPESITRAWGGKYYVSIQNTPDAVAQDGEIVQVDIGTGTVTPFVAQQSGLRNPRGLAFTGRFLVVTDTDKVWKIDQAGHVTPLATVFPFPPVLFNDAAPERGGRAVFVTEMGPGRAVQRDPAGFLWPTDSLKADEIPTAARVYRVTLDGKATNVFTPTRKILVTNGVTESRRRHGDEGADEGKHLLALDFFHGSVVDVDTRKDTKTIIATGPFRGCDGIEQAKDGTIFVTGFENGRVWRMDSNGENVVKLLDLATDLNITARQTAADLALDEEANLLYVPDTAHSQIIVLKTQ
jgi:sugar lactone lactonase YvrE